MRKLMLLFWVLPLLSHGQVSDNFSDGNYTANPSWKGDSALFKISTYTGSGWSVPPRLQLNGSAADTTILYVASPMSNLDNKEWDFFVRLAMNTSISNNCRVYLASDSANLRGSLNGYFVMFGDDVNSQLDSISLWKQNGVILQKLIAGHNTFTGATGNYRIKVQRDATGIWSLYSDATGGNNFIMEGTAFDNSINSSAWFGFYCKYTLTNITNFYFDDVYAGPQIVDTVPPLVASIHASSATQLDVLFNETVNTITAETLSNYLVSGIGNPVSATQNALNHSLVQLTFATSFTEGISYNIHIVQVTDAANNPMAAVDLPFSYFNPKPFDVVINEIMADPDPVVGLPDYEYLELYNRTAYNLNLKDWSLTIGTSVLTFPDINILPHSYLIICDDAAESSLSTFGSVLSFPSLTLTNTGATICLKDQNNIPIHYIKYDVSWYHDTSKDGGGWSIEQIDPTNVCGEATNWTASVAAFGGTPGSQNSVFHQNPDTIAPYIVNIKIINPTEIELLMNEILSLPDTLDASHFLIDKGIGIAQSAVLISPDNKKIQLTLSNPLQASVLYTLTYSDTIFDCVGNYLSVLHKSFIMYTAKPYDIVINEIMADPEPVIGLPNYEYLELYNRTNVPISLSGWKLALSSSIKPFPDITIQPKAFLIVAPEGSISAFSQYGSVAEISGFTVTNTGQIISLLDTLQHVISFVNFSDKWYRNTAKANGGWSLEKIDPDNTCAEITNWNVSEDPSGGTPGRTNSVAANNPDFVLPVLTRASASRWDLHQIKLYFDETLDSIRMKISSKYTVDNGIGNPYFVKLAYPDNKTVTLKFSAALQPKTVYTLTVGDSIFDCAGNKLPSNSTIKFAIPELPDSADLVINEVLPSPKDNGVEFVEIYNRSKKILDFKDLLLASRADFYMISSDDFLSFPGDYTLLSSDEDMVKSQYFTDNPYGFITMETFPSLLNDEGIVILKTITDTIIDAMNYNADMQFPLLSSTAGVSLERIDYNRPASDFTNWHSASESVGFATPGYKNSQYLENNSDDGILTLSPEIFSPDNDGYNDVLNITCKTEGTGKVLNIMIYDSKGRQVKYLIKNAYTTGENTYSWDGTTDNNQKANIGIYIVYVEFFDEAGKVKHYKKTAVLATKF